MKLNQHILKLILILPEDLKEHFAYEFISSTYGFFRL